MANGRTDVLDYSWSRPSHGAVKVYGVKGCMRYLYANGKGLTVAEVAQFRASGLALGLNYEAGAGDYHGRSTGIQHATAAEGFARFLGLGGNPIIFSSDWDVSRSQYGDVADALGGSLSVLGDGKVGIYGHADLMDAMHDRYGDRIYYWQTYAWSNGRRSPHADLYQFRNGQTVAGASVDFNEITGRTFWALGDNGHSTSGGGVPLTPVAPPPDYSEENDVFVEIEPKGWAIIPIPDDATHVRISQYDVQGTGTPITVQRGGGSAPFGDKTHVDMLAEKVNLRPRVSERGSVNAATNGTLRIGDCLAKVGVWVGKA